MATVQRAAALARFFPPGSRVHEPVAMYYNIDNFAVRRGAGRYSRGEGGGCRQANYTMYTIGQCTLRAPGALFQCLYAAVWPLHKLPTGRPHISSYGKLQLSLSALIQTRSRSALLEFDVCGFDVYESSMCVSSVYEFSV